MIEKVLNRKNLYKAYRKVVRNKGSAGVDGMKVTDLLSYLESNRDARARECEGGARSAAASEGHQILSYWDMHSSRLIRKGSKRAEREEIFRWKILAKSQPEGGIGGEEEQLGITQTQAQADNQENQTIQL